MLYVRAPDQPRPLSAAQHGRSHQPFFRAYCAACWCIPLAQDAGNVPLVIAVTFVQPARLLHNTIVVVVAHPPGYSDNRLRR